MTLLERKFENQNLTIGMYGIAYNEFYVYIAMLVACLCFSFDGVINNGDPR